MAVAAPCPIEALQAALGREDPWGIESAQRSLNQILQKDLWSVRGPFGSFGQFAVALPPAGLGIRTTPAAKSLRDLLIGLGYHAKWADVLILICRPPGRPKMLVEDEVCRRFYKMPTASTSIDRTLYGLHRNQPEIFARLQAGEIAYSDAAALNRKIRDKKAQLRRSLEKLAEKERCELMFDCFSRMSANVQREFIATRLNLVPDVDLAAALKQRQAAASEAWAR